MFSHRHIYVAILALAAASEAVANNYPSIDTNSKNSNASASQLNNIHNQSGAQSHGNSSILGNTQMYVLPAPVSAANLPAFNCPLGDSLSFSIGWNFFSYARSSIRTEMECLDKTLAVMRATTVPAPQLTPTAQIHPVCTTEYVDSPVFLVTESKRDVPPRKTIAKKTVRVCK